MRSKETDALDRLYAAPLEEFTPLRRALAAELRPKDPASARRLEHAAKPTRTAWALDQVARREPRLLEALVATHDAAAAAQKHGDSAGVLRTSREFREAVAAAVRAARDVLAEAGFAATAAQARRMAETLQAAAAQPSEARRQLLAGRLVRDVTLDDPLAGLEAGPARRKSKIERAVEAKPARGGRAHTEKRAAEQRAAALRAAREREAAQKAARARLAALEAEASAARAEARRAEVEATRAREAAERARRKALDLDAKLRREKLHQNEKLHQKVSSKLSS